MFSVDLDHLNILVMLILAFFSFKNYRGDNLALEYQSEDQEEVHQTVEPNCQNVQNIEESQSKSQQMLPEPSQSLIESASDIVLVVDDSVPVSGINESQQPSPSLIDIQKIDEECHQVTIITSSIQEKDSDQQSTLLNRNANCVEILMSNEQECGDEDEEIFSSDNSSSSCCSSSVLGSQNGDDINQSSNRKQKRKVIQKARRKLKKELKRRQNHHQSQDVIRLVEMQ